MSRRYGQVPLSLWRHPAVRQLTTDAKLALLFFWSGPHSTSAGIGRVPDAYATDDLDWPTDRWVQARTEVEAAGLIRRDAETETVLVCGYLQANKPQNAKHRAAIVGQITSIECRFLHEAAVAALAEAEGRGQVVPLPATGQTSDLTPQLAAMMGGRT